MSTPPANPAHTVTAQPQDEAARKASGDAIPDSSPKARQAEHLANIEGYRITGVLGQGGMGIVYRAVQIKLNRAVALKVLPAMIGRANPSAVARFRREATAAARLHHSNIVPIYDFGEARDGYYYAMELIEGHPLNELVQLFAQKDVSTASPAQLVGILQNSGAPAVSSGSEEDASVTLSASRHSASGSVRGRAYFRQVARWIGDAALALQYAHSEGIIHRDIKPANMILARDGRIMIADFGLAKSAEDKSVTITGSLVGTVRYLSPEQAMARRLPVDHRTDIYSLGATLYELLCMQPAFPGTDEKQVLSAIITRDPTPPRKVLPAVPAELETICLKALEKAPDARYATARELAEDLERFLDDLPIVARKPGPIRRLAKFVRRNRALSVSIAAVVLLGATVALWFNEIDRRQMERVNTHLAQAESYLRTRQYTDAVAEYRTALHLDPKNVRAMGNLALVLKEHYDRQAEPDDAVLDEALFWCDQAMRHHPHPDQARDMVNFCADTMSLKGRYDEARSALLSMMEADPPTYARYNLAALDFLAGDMAATEEALARITESLAGDPDPWCHAWWALAAVQLYQQKAEAVESIESGLNCGTSNEAWFHLFSARIRLTLNGARDARTALSHAIVADENEQRRHPLCKRFLALARLRNDDFQGAIDEAQRAIDLGDMATPNLLIQAAAFAELGQIAAARAALEQAEQVWPEALKEPGSFTRGRLIGRLWFESADELAALQAEARKLISGPRSP